MSTAIPRALRRLVVERSGGFCEYCLIPERAVFIPHQVDHIIAIKHGGSTDLDNLALSCALCNKHKGSDIASIDPKTGALVALYHPRRDRWLEHFEVEGAILRPRTPITP